MSSNLRSNTKDAQREHSTFSSPPHLIPIYWIHFYQESLSPESRIYLQRQNRHSSSDFLPKKIPAALNKFRRPEHFKTLLQVIAGICFAVIFGGIRPQWKYLVFCSSFGKVDPIQKLFFQTARSPRESTLQMFGAGADFILSSIQRELYFKLIILLLLVGFVTLILRIADLLVTHSRLIELGT